TQSYMSRIRGGLNWYDVRIGDEPLHGPAPTPDLLVALTDDAREVLGGELADDGRVLHNSDAPDDGAVVAIDLERVAQDVADKTLYMSAVAAGAVFGLLGYDPDALGPLLEEEFADKGDDVVAANRECVDRGAELAAEEAGQLDAPEPGGEARAVYDGATAVGLAAAAAGVKLVAAYPMTPATATFTFLAAAADDYGIVVEQAEDEIAAINMVCGAAYAGVPAMTMTSGGGLALMSEGLSLAGMMELPVVILVAQRPAPATGLPTRTAQQDLLFALRAGHGEFPRAIFTPGSVRQCYDLTRRALETAHRYQTPVLILTDQFLQDMEQSMAELDDSPAPIDRRIVTDPGDDYERYAVTDSGISPRAIPGGSAVVVCDSDEHATDGHIAEDINGHIEQQDKRMRKEDGLRDEALGPERIGPDDADTLLLAWGSTCGPAREAVDLLNADGGSVALLHFAQVWPLDTDAVADAIGAPDRLVCVEGNQTGQFRTLLRSVGLAHDCELLTNYTGLPFTGADIAERIRQ
ncbi:MAG: 2-oxoacid:acceptor oxidoreductase subunit alpha, partial [Planctomycetota bacterium]